ncbi:MAG: hypothetical protein UT48_C0008G0045 [Parcubacteria group bacterium GW2011_GWE2_39_37]|nr:MAG: hypothetical protein UT48_C0008G0045 [Parcubacteria group bacterium GW2011_GWE2_39_37]
MAQVGKNDGILFNFMIYLSTSIYFMLFYSCHPELVSGSCS